MGTATGIVLILAAIGCACACGWVAREDTSPDDITGIALDVGAPWLGVAVVVCAIAGLYLLTGAA